MRLAACTVLGRSVENRCEMALTANTGYGTLISMRDGRVGGDGGQHAGGLIDQDRSLGRREADGPFAGTNWKTGRRRVGWKNMATVQPGQAVGARGRARTGAVGPSSTPPG